MGSSETLRLPVINFSGLDLSDIGTDRWIAVSAQVIPALKSYGCFEAIYDKVTPEIRAALFGKAVKEVFSLPLEAKEKNTSDKPYHGYINLPGNDYESLVVEEATDREGIEKFSTLMWGANGNPFFRDIVCSFAKHLSELDQMVRRMVLESLGIEKYFATHVKSTTASVRLSKYRAPQTDHEASVLGMRGHTDVSTTAIVCQQGVEGLEVRNKDGRWMKPLPNSLTFIVGQAFWAWTNGRFEPPYHRVSVAGKETRYSIIFGSRPRDGYLVQAPEELVDDDNQLQFKPYYYGDYVHFCYSEAGMKIECPLRAYCGVGDGKEIPRV